VCRANWAHRHIACNGLDSTCSMSMVTSAVLAQLVAVGCLSVSETRALFAWLLFVLL
jgi:hypothetical protein